jgi:hypothetical protein
MTPEAEDNAPAAEKRQQEQAKKPAFPTFTYRPGY